jgi:hypothetical protein
MIILSADDQRIDFALPALRGGRQWECVVNTALPDPFRTEPCTSTTVRPIAPRSLVLLRAGAPLKAPS